MLTKAFAEEVLLTQRLALDAAKIKSLEDTLRNSLSISELVYVQKAGLWRNTKITSIDVDTVKLVDDKTGEILSVVH